MARKRKRRANLSAVRRKSPVQKAAQLYARVGSTIYGKGCGAAGRMYREARRLEAGMRGAKLSATAKKRLRAAKAHAVESMGDAGCSLRR